jgi:hypothetical protein
MGRVPLVSSLLHSVVRGGQFRPKPLGAGARRHCPKLFAPVPVVAELASPGPQAARVTLQSVFLREADGAVNLMRNRGAYSNRPVSAQFRRRDLKAGSPSVRCRAGGLHDARDGCHFRSKNSELLLDRLEFCNSLTELLSLTDVVD